MSNLNEGVGKKIVEALKKQSEVEAKGFETAEVSEEPESLSVDVSSIDEITNGGFISGFNSVPADDAETESSDDFLAENIETAEQDDNSFDDFMNVEERTPEAADMPGNIIVLKKLISQLPSGVTRHTGAQIIRQTMEALGISMKSVLTEAQDVQNSLKESTKECQATIQEYKRKIVALEKQTQNYQKQYSALNDLISLFIQTTK